MKKYIILIFTALLSVSVFAQSENIIKADEAYKNGDYRSAISLYEDVLKTEGFSENLYYNLGNAYYKDKQYPQAILNYERALLIDPGFSDAQFNLELAKINNVDKIDAIDEFFLSGWFRSLREIISSNEWAYWGIISFIIAIIGLFLFLFSKKMILRKIGFFGGLLFIVVSVFCNFSSYKLKKDALSRDYAIVFTPTITVKGSPAESGTELFVIHEGTKVKIRSTLGDWSEIEIADGNVGWMLSNGLEKI